MSQSNKQMAKEMFDDMYKVEPSFHVTSEGAIKPIGVSSLENKMVDSPPHYNQGGIETIDYMKAYSTKEEFMGHCRLTTIKYLSQLMEKENPLQDAKKARWYLNKLIEELCDL